MLDRRFMESKKLNSVPRDARLVYASVLPFVDREGRTIAESLYLKAMVFRHSDFTQDEIATAIRQLADAGLLRLYANEDNAAIVEYVNFTRFNSPNVKESKSDLPGPDDDGVMPCREPAPDHARALHVQRTGIASGERKLNVNGTSTINENVNVNPPTPHAEEHATTEDEDDGREIVEEAFTAIGRRRSQNHATGLLAQQAMRTYAGLQDLQGVYKLEPTQYRIYAAKLLELARDHGDELTAAALEAVVLSSERIKQPLPYIKKILANHAAESARLGTTEVGAIDFKGDLERLFGAN